MEGLPASWFARHSGLALYVAGFSMVVAGVMFENQAAVKTALILIGAGLVLVGVLLPRLSGTLEITTSGVKIPIVSVLERLEVTRREAELRAPDRVQEAVGRAYELLAPLLAAGDDLRFAVAPPTPTRPADLGGDADHTEPRRGSITCPACGHVNEEWATFCGSCGQFLEWAGEHIPPGAGPTKPRTPPAAPPDNILMPHPKVLRPAPTPTPKGGCAACGHVNEESRRFCKRCGEPLHRAGEQKPAGARPSRPVTPPAAAPDKTPKPRPAPTPTPKPADLPSGNKAADILGASPAAFADRILSELDSKND